MYAISSSFTGTYGGQRYESIIEYVDDQKTAMQRMLDWAAWHDAVARLSRDGCYFDKPDGTTFRLERVDAEQVQS